MDKGYRLKITVLHSDEQIFREVDIFTGSKFIDLHNLIQIVFGFKDKFGYRFKLKDGQELNDEERISKYLNEVKVFNYEYYYWDFEITIEKVYQEVILFSQVINYQGYNLIDGMMSVAEYRETLREVDLSQLEFDLIKVNENLQVKAVVNNTALRDDYTLALKQIHQLIKNRDIKEFQVIKLNSEMTTYWVIIKTMEGYVIELFENYEDLQQGFYHLQAEAIDHAFCYCHTFLLTDDSLGFEPSLDDGQHYGAFFNEPGFIPSQIAFETGPLILNWLNELIIVLANDNNISETDEIIEAWLENNNFKNSSVFVYEVEANMSKYDFGYYGQREVTTSLELREQVCVEVVCLPTLKSNETNELAVYVVVASKDEYLIRPVDYCVNQVIGEILIDTMIDFIELYGKPKQIIVSNLNVLFLILEFLNREKIGYLNGDTSEEVDLALGDAFYLEEEIEDLLKQPFVRELMKEFEGKSDAEIKAKLDELFLQTELLN